MQFSVPQFVEIEDKIFGPLTLKQFLIMVAAGVVCFLFYSIFKLSIVFFVLALPVAGIAAGLAFAKFNGRPVMANIGGFIKFYSTPRIRVFIRSSDKTVAMVKKKPEKPQDLPADQHVDTSRLKRLAYLLDQKAAEEERLIRGKTGELTR